MIYIHRIILSAILHVFVFVKFIIFSNFSLINGFQIIQLILLNQSFVQKITTSSGLALNHQRLWCLCSWIKFKQQTRHSSVFESGSKTFSVRQAFRISELNIYLTSERRNSRNSTLSYFIISLSTRVNRESYYLPIYTFVLKKQRSDFWQPF